MQELITLIKKKKELSQINDSIIVDEIKKLNLKQDLKPKEIKAVIKEVRANLRRKYGLFRKGAKKRDKILEEYLQPNNKELILELLKTHASTKERLLIYKDLYKKIFQLTKAKTIKDIGCAINPISIDLMPIKPTKYYAYDISDKDIEDLNKFFKHNKDDKSYKAEFFNLFNFEKILDLPKTDLTFLFKVTDIIDQGKGHKNTEKIITQLKSEYIVLSFPTKTMSGKKMRAPKRNWVVWLCNRLEYEHQLLEYENEIFYIIKKHLKTNK